MTLIHTFAPHADDESGLGYYRRLSAANARSSWKDLARDCGDSANQNVLLGHAELVASALGLETDWCHQASEQENRAAGWSGMRRRRRDAVCVHCLQEDAYLRTIWEHAYLVACPRHGVRLRDTCPSCAQPLRSTREHVSHCDCGLDLRTMAPEPATSAQMWVSSLLVDGHARVDGCGPAIEAVDISVAASLIGTLCKHANLHVPARRLNAAAPATLKALEIFLSPLETLLANWPANFEQHVSERIKSGPQEARTLNKRLGSWYQQLSKLSGHAAIHPFLGAIGVVAEAEFEGLLGRDAASRFITKAAPQVPLMEAATRIGIAYSQLQHFNRKGALRSVRMPAGRNAHVYMVAVEDIEDIKLARRMWTSEEEACTMMGVPPAVLAHLSEAGVLVRDTKWQHDLRKGGPIDVASVQRLIGHLHAAAATAPTGEGRRMKLKDLSARHVGDKKALASAFQAIASGAVCLFAADGAVGDFEFLWDDLAKYYARPVLDQGLTVQQLSEATGYKHECIANWIGCGLLTSHDVLLRGQPCRVVTPSQLAAFRREYVPLSDLASTLGVKSSALARQLTSIGTVGWLTLSDGVRRGGLVPVAELTQAALKGAAL